jgi:hypothetical protein
MDLESVSQQHLNELENSVRALLALMRKAKLHHEPVAEQLRQLEVQIAEVRRARFDEANPEYHGY